MKRYLLLMASALIFGFAFDSCKKEQQESDTVSIDSTSVTRDVWTKEQANNWYQQWGWLRGSDFIPSTAINQLEMWQAETFDTATINRELGWAASIGMNSMRVYLHHLAWELDPAWFKERINQYSPLLIIMASLLFLFFLMIAGVRYKAGNNLIQNPAPTIQAGFKILVILIHEDSTL